MRGSLFKVDVTYSYVFNWKKKNPNYYPLIDSLDSQQFNKHNDDDDDNTDD